MVVRAFSSKAGEIYSSFYKTLVFFCELEDIRTHG